MTENDTSSGADQRPTKSRWRRHRSSARTSSTNWTPRAAAGSDSAVSGVEGLPAGSALLVVKRGPNAGSRFLLDQADHVGGSASRQRHLPRRRHRQPSPRRVPPGGRRVPGRRRRQPQRHLRQPRAGRLGGARQRRRGPDRQVPPGVPDRAQDRRRQPGRLGVSVRAMTQPDTPALAGMSIGAVLDLLRPDFPDVTISKIRFLEAEGLVTPERTALGLSAVHRVRLCAAAVHPDRAARPVPAAEGHQGAAGRATRRRAARHRIRLRRTASGARLADDRDDAVGDTAAVAPAAGPAEPRGSAGPFGRRRGSARPR